MRETSPSPNRMPLSPKSASYQQARQWVAQTDWNSSNTSTTLLESPEACILSLTPNRTGFNKTPPPGIRRRMQKKIEDLTDWQASFWLSRTMVKRCQTALAGIPRCAVQSIHTSQRRDRMKSRIQDCKRRSRPHTNLAERKLSNNNSVTRAPAKRTRTDIEKLGIRENIKEQDNLSSSSSHGVVTKYICSLMIRWIRFNNLPIMGNLFLFILFHKKWLHNCTLVQGGGRQGLKKKSSFFERPRTKSRTKKQIGYRRT